ncbi:hypothetical protein K3555_08510 [Leisingera sp. M527]|uniref:hypothetical protein n=1 Tax=Leisingera sp. M527 TaxID=2867014 RepID=UPI0021A8788A|nr:hypothetical protein [Leisingera sp. M527]UWQ34507.1 hypothetical protein K3555_08510 [Leisingera sp. M527]
MFGFEHAGEFGALFCKESLHFLAIADQLFQLADLAFGAGRFIGAFRVELLAQLLCLVAQAVDALLQGSQEIGSVMHLPRQHSGAVLVCWVICHEFVCLMRFLSAQEKERRPPAEESGAVLVSSSCNTTYTRTISKSQELQAGLRTVGAQRAAAQAGGTHLWAKQPKPL